MIASPVSFSLKLPREVQEIALNGTHLTPTRENLFMIPAGQHTITLSPDAAHELSGHQIEPRIMSLSGNLLSVSYSMRSIQFEYEADGRTLVSLNREPVSVRLDGQEYAFTSMKGNDCYSIFLPSGRHAVEVVAGDVFSFGIQPDKLLVEYGHRTLWIHCCSVAARQCMCFG